MVLFYIVGAIFVISAILFMVEIKKAPLIDDKEPFLHGDYDEKNDPIIIYEGTFCKNCAYSDHEKKCLHENNIGNITEESIKNCQVNSMFEPR